MTLGQHLRILSSYEAFIISSQKIYISDRGKMMNSQLITLEHLDSVALMTILSFLDLRVTTLLN